jgi:transcriptional regulator with XRE-family HTH domain
MPGAEVFAARLKELRIAAGLTQQELAQRIGMSLRQVSRLETGENVPTWPTILSLASALGVTCQEFQQAPATLAEAPRRGRPRKS